MSMPAASSKENDLIQSEEELEERLSRPAAADLAAMASLSGDLLILGVSGKVGPSLARLARRACEKAGVEKRIVGVARFSQPEVRGQLEGYGVETLPCNLLDRGELAQLPDCPNVIFMAGQKFGTSGDQPLTWATNAYLPAIVAERFPDSRIVAFSTGNVYPLTPVASGGPKETDPVGPVGEYAQSALARERIFEYFSRQNGTPIAQLRLNYAIDLRYGVLRDIAEKVFQRRPVDLATGYANVIWQRDANSIALRSFAHCASPPFVLNMTGAEIISVREIAKRFGAIWGIEPRFEGAEANTALLSDASLCRELFGPPEVSIRQMVEWLAHWIGRGGRGLGKPTHFEDRAGNF
jgi:nucleoside-diphosphate-sugar epimerase